jgi:hypothetical protein
MNPFNHSPLTPDQLRSDCLAYLSIQQKPVKSSRLFLGHMHDVNVKRLTRAFGLKEDAYKNIPLNGTLMRSLEDRNKGSRVFFRNGIPEDYTDQTVEPKSFRDFEEAYHCLMLDLVDLATASIKLIIGKYERTVNLYITGGFAKNPIFLKGIARRFMDKKVYTSEIPNATSLGAALVLWKTLEPGRLPEIDLGLRVQ